MNQKEVNELRRRMAPDKNSIQTIYGCYVNGRKEIVSYLDSSLGLMPEQETETYLALLKKALSGKLGRNLIDIVFSIQQVMDSPEHRLLLRLRDSGLEDGEAREQFYQQIISALDMEEQNYVILLVCDAYDVPRRRKDGAALEDDSDSVFRYLLCAVCPVKDGKLALGYFAGDNEFHGCMANQLVTPPELGFLFPAFDDRAANIHNALYYAKNPAQLHQDFIDAVFRTEAPMSAAEQREAFQSALSGALGEACSYALVQTVHGHLRERLQQHLDAKDPEPLRVSPREVADILEQGGATAEQAQAFLARCGDAFGEKAALDPANIIDSGRFELVTPQTKIAVDPEYSYLVQARVIDGRRFLLVPAEEAVEVNGLEVTLQ